MMRICGRAVLRGVLRDQSRRSLQVSLRPAAVPHALRFKSTEVATEDISALDASLENASSEVIDSPILAPKVVEKSPKEELMSQGLSERLCNNLVKIGVTHLFPVQLATLPALKEGKDLIVRSKTGSGKTLAFALPIIDRIYMEQANGGRTGPGAPRAVVLAPTRELALQVHKEFERLAPDLRCVSVYGGAPIGRQLASLSRQVDVVIGTPGRMVDLVQRGNLDLSNVAAATLDEADEMLKQGFEEEIEIIYSAMPPKDKRQNLLFSATVSPEIRHAAKSFLNEGIVVDLVGDNAQSVPSDIKMIAMPAHRGKRFEAIAQILSNVCKGRNSSRALVFLPTKGMTEELCSSKAIVGSGVRCNPMHGDMQQQAREVALSAFRDGRINCLVATDVAARGLDIPEVDYVIHFEVPQQIESFVHRTGRTGRAGRAGTNILLYSPGEDSLTRLERTLKTKFETQSVPGSYELTVASLDGVEDRLNKLKNKPDLDYTRFAHSLIVGKSSEETEDVVANLVSLLIGDARPLEFSLLSGRAEVQTLRVPLDDSVFPRSTSPVLSSRASDKIKSVYEEIIKGEFYDQNLSTPSHLVSHVEVSEDGLFAFIDLPRNICSVLLESKPDEFTRASILPALLKSARPAPSASYGGGSRGRGGGYGNSNYGGNRSNNRGGYEGQNRGGYEGNNRGGYEGQNRGGYGNNRGEGDRGGYSNSRGGYRNSRGGSSGQGPSKNW